MPTPKPKMGDNPRSGHPMVQGLVALYPFVDASGNTLTDFSGNGHNGTLIDLDSDPWLTEEEGAIQFNGTGYIDLGNVLASLFDADFTIITDVYSINATTQFILTKETNQSSGFALFGRDTQHLFEYRLNWVTGQELQTNSFPLLTWQRVILTRNSGTISFYVDGIFESSTTDNDQYTSTQSVLLGKTSWSSSLIWQGRMTDVRIYNRGFSALEATLDFADPWAMFAQPLRNRKNSRIDQLRDRIHRRLLSERGSFVYNPELGSELHLLTRAKNLEEVYTFAENEVRSALRPEIQKGHILDISEIRVKEKTLNTVSLEIDILANNQEQITVPVLIS